MTLSDSLQHPAIGRPIEDLDTPALLLDLSAAERNLARMAEAFRDTRCKLRPHFKNHKCVGLARRQIAAGSIVGMTAATLGEAEVLAEHGFDDVLIANQVLGDARIARLVEIAKMTNLKVAVDDAAQASAISKAAANAGAIVGVLVEIDGGMGRCGVQPGQPALELARRIRELPGLELVGLQCFEGHAVYIDDVEERARLCRESMQKALATRERMEGDGMSSLVISGGASSTYQTVRDLQDVDELQCGSYATMDWRYHELVPEFEIALSILVRVISRQPDRIVIDLGVKRAGDEFGKPRIVGRPAADIPFFKAEEHCVIRNLPDVGVGDTLQVIPSHACTTCNLHRQMHVHQDGRVIDVWPIEASGK